MHEEKRLLDDFDEGKKKYKIEKKKGKTTPHKNKEENVTHQTVANTRRSAERERERERETLFSGRERERESVCVRV